MSRVPARCSTALLASTLVALSLAVAGPAVAEPTEPPAATAGAAAPLASARAVAMPTSGAPTAAPTSALGPAATTSPSASNTATPGTTLAPSATATASATPTAGPTATAGATSVGPSAGPGASPTGSATGSATGAATATARAANTSLAKAADFVVASLKDGNHVEGSFGPDLGQTADVALGLAAAGDQPAALDAVVAYLAANAGDYVHGNPSFGEKAGANYAGPTAKLLLVALAAGEDPESFGGINLVSELRALMVAKGAKTGRFADDSKFGDFSNLLGQAFGVLALERATSAGAAKQAVAYLSAAQCPDGGFPETFGAKTCSSSPDATGLVVQALIAANADCSAARAVRWLTSRQSRSGAYTANAVDPTKPAVANVNSTAYAGLGLLAARRSTTRPVGYLVSVQNANGGLPTVPSTSRASNLFATAQALPLLARTSFLTVGDRPLAARTPTCPAAAPTSTPVPSSSTTTAPNPPTIEPTIGPTTGPTTGPSAAPIGSAGGPGTTTGQTASAGPDVTASTGSDEATTAVAAGIDGLPRTGTDLLTPVAAGGLLVFVGLLLVLLARRPTGRHS